MNRSMTSPKRVLSAWTGVVIILLLLQSSGALQTIHLHHDHGHDHDRSDSDHQSCHLCLLLHAAISLPPVSAPPARHERTIASLPAWPVQHHACHTLPAWPVRGPPMS